MREEREILDSVIGYASSEDAVRAVIRTELVPVREYLYTYNFCFIVNDIAKFDDDGAFADRFGERILLFRGDKNYPEMFPGTKAHLMVFRDGVTIVIHAMDSKAFLERFNREKHYENVWIGDTFKKLLDKDNMLPDIDRMEEKQILFADRPSEEEYAGACSEFWWVLKTFAEYTLRDELPSAMFYLNVSVRDILNKMLRWHIFLQAGKPVDMGILDSNLEKLLEPDLFALYRKTYSCAERESLRKAFDAVVALWRKAGNSVAESCGYLYPRKTEEDMLRFIHGLKEIK